MPARTPRSLPSLLLALALACGGLALDPRALAAQPALPSQGAFDQTHALWTEVLQTCVRDGGFDYARLKAERSKFDAYLSALHAVTPQDLAAWTNEQRFAFWINCYNAHCIQRVLDNYPLKSIKKLSGAFGLNSVFD